MSDVATDDPANVENPTAPPASPKPERGLDADVLTQLPAYTRSLLKVSVPASVRLATKKESVQEIVEMAPGTILTFEKGCDELLELAIGELVIAEGEAVKVGDKFGFRVHQMVLPEEHFAAVRRPGPPPEPSQPAEESSNASQSQDEGQAESESEAAETEQDAQ